MFNKEDWLKFFEDNKEEIIEKELMKSLYKMGDYIDDKTNEDFDWDSGASKYCIIPKNCPFVFKWDKIGENECEREYQNYIASLEYGLTMLFPKTEVFYTIGRWTIYIQEKVDFSAGSVPRKQFDKYIKMTCNVKLDLVCKVNNHCFGPTNIDSLWLKMLILLYGKKITKKFEKFTNDFKINDLHMDNIGYINNRPVVLDFSGYGNR